MRLGEKGGRIPCATSRMPMIKRPKPPGQSSAPKIDVRLRKVAPVEPTRDGERVELVKDLSAMGCIGFMGKPWNFKNEAMVRELLEGAPNQFGRTMRSAADTWTDVIWQLVYDIQEGGEMQLASSKYPWIKGKFKGPANAKDGFAIEDCISSRNRRLLEFLVPILHSEKPTRLTTTLGNTIFGSLSGEWKMDWGLFICSMVTRLVGNLTKSRATPICPYLYHLYKHLSLLTANETNEWRAQ